MKPTALVSLLRRARPASRALAPLLALAGALASPACQRRAAPAPQPTVAALPAEATATPNGRVAITVDNDGYHPSTVHATAGQPVTLVFTRTADEMGCGERVVFAEQNITRELPPGRPVEVTVTPSAGRLAFACGMNMYRGAVVVQ